MRLAILTSHPVQYYAPLFRELAKRVDLHVFFAHEATAAQQAAAGFNAAFTWDVDLRSGYSNSFLRNIAREPSAAHFNGCDTPDVGQELRAGRFDAVLCIGWHLKFLVQGIFAAKRLGLPVMIRGDSQRGLSSSLGKELVKGLTYPFLLRIFDAALYVGQRNREYYEHYRFPGARLFHSPHAIDSDWFAARSGAEVRLAKRQELGLSDDERVILFAGKLLPFKRPLDMVAAVARVRQAGIPATAMIAGSGELEGELRSAAHAEGVPLVDLGFLNQTQMPAAYAAADILMLPSTRRETWGLVCNEALACGTPVVVSDEAGCAPDICTDRHVGRSYRGGDPASAAQALLDTVANPPTREEIREVSDAFSLRAAADGVIAALKNPAVSRN